MRPELLVQKTLWIAINQGNIVNQYLVASTHGSFFQDKMDKAYNKFYAIGFSNEPDTLESTSILIYSELHAGLYTQWIWLDAALIKW